MTKLVAKLLPLTVAVAALSCHCHCVATAADVQAKGLVNTLGMPPDAGVPVDPSSHDNEDESGCICRGAVFVPAIDIAELQARQLPVLTISRSPAPLAGVLDLAAANPLASLPGDEPPRVSGRMLRALISSLLI